MRPAVEGEEVPGGLELLGEIAADVEISDARRRGRMVGQRRVGVADQDRDLLDTTHIGELREGNRQAGAAGLHARRGRRGDRGEFGFQRLHRRHHSLTRRGMRWHSRGGAGRHGSDRGSPGTAVAVVDAPCESRGDHVDQVVDHEVLERRRQQVVAEVGLRDHRDLGAVPFFRAAAGEDRDRNADEVESVAGRVGGVVTLVDATEFVQVVEIPRELVEVNRRLERERLLVKSVADGVLREAKGGCAGDHDRVGPPRRLVGRGDQALDRVDHARRADRLGHRHLLRGPPAT